MSCLELLALKSRETRSVPRSESRSRSDTPCSPSQRLIDILLAFQAINQNGCIPCEGNECAFCGHGHLNDLGSGGGYGGQKYVVSGNDCDLID